MTGIRIGSNIPSLRAQRSLSASGEKLTGAFERLSSGQRINRASDDAAGLAVSMSLKADTRIYSQGVRNLNDGISALRIADGAIQCLTDIVTRLSELAEQAANGVYGQGQLRSLDDEAQALSDEYSRIARTTKFNGINLFDGTTDTLRLQCGYGLDGGIVSGLGGAIGTGSFGGRISFSTGTNPRILGLGDLNGDGVLDMATADTNGNTASVLLGNGDGTFYRKTSFSTGAGPYSITLGDVNGDGVLDINSGTRPAFLVSNRADYKQSVHPNKEYLRYPSILSEFGFPERPGTFQCQLSCD